MLPKDATAEEAKAYAKRRTTELVNAIEAVLAAHPELPEVQALDDALLHIKDPFLRVLARQEAQRFHDLTERLADLEHQQWAHWTQSMLQVLDPILIDNGVVREKEEKEALDAIERWRRQIQTPYAELSEADKENNRTWARGTLEAIEGEPIDPKIEALYKRLENQRQEARFHIEAAFDMHMKMLDSVSNLVSPMADAVLMKNRHDEAMQALADLLSLTGDEPGEVQDAAWERARSVVAPPSTT